MEKKIPQRRCTACRAEKDKRELMRVVKAPDGTVFYDRGGKTSGRGAYICKSLSCLETAQKKKCLSRALNTEVSPEIFEILKEQINA